LSKIPSTFHQSTNIGIIETVMTTALVVSLEDNMYFWLTFAGSIDRLEMDQKKSMLQARECPLMVSFMDGKNAAG
jgi:hypothetical protein